jgi:hypothetical protein
LCLGVYKLLKIPLQQQSNTTYRKSDFLSRECMNESLQVLGSHQYLEKVYVLRQFSEAPSPNLFSA